MPRRRQEEFKRVSFDELKNRIPFLKERKRIATIIDDDKALVMANFFECLMDTDHKMPTGKYEIFKLIEDVGTKRLQVGTPGGGYHGIYRLFNVEVYGVKQFAALGLNRYSADRTILCVAIINDDKRPHHALQLAIDDYMNISENLCTFFHRGAIGLGRIGSGKMKILRDKYVVRIYPKIINDTKYFLGRLHIDKLWYLDDREMIDFAENLISYALVRDMYRADALRAAGITRK